MPDHNRGNHQLRRVSAVMRPYITPRHMSVKRMPARARIEIPLDPVAEHSVSASRRAPGHGAGGHQPKPATIASTVRADKPNRTLLETAGQALKSAATGLLSVAPNVLSVTEGIIHVVQSLTRKIALSPSGLAAGIP